MRNIKVLELSVAGTALRFYTMMAVVIILGFLGQFTLAAILGYALAISFILGVSFTKTTKKTATKRKIEQIEKTLKGAA